MIYSLGLEFINDVSLVTKEVNYGMHHASLNWTVLQRQALLLFKSQTFADLIDPKLEPQVESSERFLLKYAHGIVTRVTTRNLLSPLLEVRVPHIKEIITKHVSPKL
jgi:hypothetical protein